MSVASEQERAAILADVEALLRDAFAYEAWGRLLVFMAENPRQASGVADQFVVADMQVEEVIDEARVERVFNRTEIGEALPAIAAAVTALSMIDGVLVEDVRGGTFVRSSTVRGDALAFLPAPCRTPSRSFDAKRARALEDLAALHTRTLAKMGLESLDALEAAPLRGTFTYKARGEKRTGRATVLGSFAERHRSWVWGAHNPNLPAERRKEAAEIVDNVSDRSMWEVATPGFHTDEATARALAAFVVVDRGLDGLVAVRSPEGPVLLAIRAE